MTINNKTDTTDTCTSRTSNTKTTTGNHLSTYNYFPSHQHNRHHTKLRQHHSIKNGDDTQLPLCQHTTVDQIILTVDHAPAQVLATRRAFRHTALDYVHEISAAQAKKRCNVVDAVSALHMQTTVLVVITLSDTLDIG